MSTEEMNAKAAAAFAIEMASSPVIKSLLLMADRETVYMAWSLGYVTGMRDGLGHAHDLMSGAHEG